MYKSMQLTLMIYVERSEITGPTLDDESPGEIVRRVYSALYGFRKVTVDLDPNVAITAEKL